MGDANILPLPLRVEGSIYEHMAAEIVGSDDKGLCQVWKGEGAYERATALSIAANLHPCLVAELSAAIGYMRNARIDLETGATKATAIRTIDGGIKRAEAALAKAGAL